jgi:hypothetical protein
MFKPAHLGIQAEMRLWLEEMRLQYIRLRLFIVEPPRVYNYTPPVVLLTIARYIALPLHYPTIGHFKAQLYKESFRSLRRAHPLFIITFVISGADKHSRYKAAEAPPSVSILHRNRAKHWRFFPGRHSEKARSYRFVIFIRKQKKTFPEAFQFSRQGFFHYPFRRINFVSGSPYAAYHSGLLMYTTPKCL